MMSKFVLNEQNGWGEKVQNNTPKKTKPELQLWEVTMPKPTGPNQRRSHTGRKRAHTSGSQVSIRHSHTTGRRSKAPGRPIQSIKRRQAKRRRVMLYRCLALCMFALFLVGVFKLTGIIYRGIQTRIQTDEIPAMGQNEIQDRSETDNLIEKPMITVDLLEQNPYSRPGTTLKKVKNIFVHYTANQGTSAAQNRSYFANLAETGERSASAHFIIGYEGEILQCIPLEEEAFAVRGRNNDSVSIECCYLSEDGAFTQSTYNSLIELLAWLCGEYGLSEQDILRHYDESGKKCPLYYVDHEDEWEQLLEDVAQFTAEQLPEQNP